MSACARVAPPNPSTSSPGVTKPTGFTPTPFGPGLVLHRRLGAGGMAEVFRGVQAGIGGFQKVVAVKRMLPNLAENEDFERMFQAEVNLTARLQHPNIAQVFGNGEHDGYLYVVMEFVDGRDLAKVLTLLGQRGETMPIPLAVLIAAQVARGLDYAHNFRDPSTGARECLVHRDISPQNVMVSFDGQVKVVDYGIAKVTDGVEGTRTGTVRGKLAYMAPEQAGGQPFDHRVDVFALGVVLHECLTGARLFRGANQADTLRRVLACEIAPPSAKNAAIPPQLDAIVMRALAKDAVHRYASAHAMERDLGAFLAAHAPSVVSRDLGGFVSTVFADAIAQERDDDRVISSELAPTANTPIKSMTAAPGTAAPGTAAGSPTATRPVTSAPRLLVVPARAPPPSSTARWLVPMTLGALVAAAAVAWRAWEPPVEPRVASDVSGLVGWFRADALALGPNERVARWASSSTTFPVEATQPDAARQPVLLPNVLGGSAVVSFDGAQFLLADAVTEALREARGLTVLFVGRPTADRAQFVVAVQQQDPNIDVARIGYTSPDGVRVKVSPKQARQYYDSKPQALYGFAIYTMVVSREAVEVFMDGRSIIREAIAAPPLAEARRLSIGQEWDEGGQPSDFFEGQLAELAIYERALEPEERRSVEAYLAKKYALAR